MLRIRTYLHPSSIHGIGVFSLERLFPERLIWSFEENFDRRYSQEDFSKLSPAILEYYNTYGYESKSDGLFYFPFDNDRFMNHSSDPNIIFRPDGNFYATRIIEPHEEVTCDYSQFDVQWPTYAYQFEAALNVVDKKMVTA